MTDVLAFVAVVVAVVALRRNCRFPPSQRAVDGLNPPARSRAASTPLNASRSPEFEKEPTT